MVEQLQDKGSWKVAGVAKKSKSGKSINCYVGDGVCLVLDIAELLELVAGHYVEVDILEHT
jgi:hypothetical protein